MVHRGLLWDLMEEEVSDSSDPLKGLEGVNEAIATSRRRSGLGSAETAGEAIANFVNRQEALT